ncbi:MAG: hypothetical protein R2699_06185 [Acidimicrobiales bacterium]
MPSRSVRPSDFDAELIFAACAKFDVAVEINCRPERQDPPDDLLELALEWDCKVSIDTDAHAPGQLEWRAYGCDKAAAHGIDPNRIVTTGTPTASSRLDRRPRNLTSLVPVVSSPRMRDGPASCDQASMPGRRRSPSRRG